MNRRTSMEGQAESVERPDADALLQLGERRDAPSLLRLGLQVSAFACAAALVASSAGRPFAALLAAIPLGAIWASLFAPFHECIHRTAFRSRRWNTFGAWLTAFPFGVAPSVFRAFHFAHHRHTNDPGRDPELQFLPNHSATERGHRFVWLALCLGLRPLALRTALTLTCAFLPGRFWRRLLPWTASEKSERLAWESRLVAAFWIGIVLLLWKDARLPVVLASLAVAHLFLGVWLTTEHTGLPEKGSMFERTRSVISSPFVRWWLWNMNYHAEHHAWPAIPWHRLPELHACIPDRLPQEAPSYRDVHADALFRTDKSLPGAGVTVNHH